VKSVGAGCWKWLPTKDFALSTTDAPSSTDFTATVCKLFLALGLEVKGFDVLRE